MRTGHSGTGAGGAFLLSPARARVHTGYDMKHYHKNPREITKKQFDQLKEWLDELGDLSGIVHDLNSDEIIGGNQRVRALGVAQENPVITETFDPPTRQGTVVLGYFEANGGERYQYRAVRWTSEQCEKANIIANKAGGSWDQDILANEWEVDNLLEWGFEPEELGIVEQSDPPEEDVVIKDQWLIVIECESEAQQIDLLGRFGSEGLKCRALVS